MRQGAKPVCSPHAPGKGVPPPATPAASSRPPAAPSSGSSAPRGDSWAGTGHRARGRTRPQQGRCLRGEQKGYVKGICMLKVHVCSRYIRTSTHSHDKAHDTGTALPEAAIHGATCSSSFPGTLHTVYTSPPTKPQQEIHNRDNLSNNSAIVQGGQVRIENGTQSHSENHFVLFRQ